MQGKNSKKYTGSHPYFFKENIFLKNFFENKLFVFIIKTFIFLFIFDVFYLFFCKKSNVFCWGDRLQRFTKQIFPKNTLRINFDKNYIKKTPHLWEIFCLKSTP